MASGALSAVRRLSTVIAIAIVFVFGLGTTVYLSLRSPEVTVPDVLGKDRLEAERVLGDAGLNFRVRAFRPSSELKADTVLFQLPRPGEVVKAGQTVAMDLSRTVKEGESSEIAAPAKADEKANRNTNDNTANENKPKRKSTNKNANENANANSINVNANANLGNRNANANRAPSNRNANIGNANTTTNASSTKPVVNTNSNRAGNQNENRRPLVPKPSPVKRPNP